MPPLHVPKYPVVDPDPDLSTTIKNYNFRDYLNIALFTGSGAAFGFFGASRHLRATTARFIGGIGLFAGLCFASQSSWQRLMGLDPNEAEVARYGAMSQEQLNAWYARSNDDNAYMIGKTKSEE